jgi:cation diffusion facilitator family transporter
LLKILTRLFVKNGDDTSNPDVRAAYGNMSGIVGIILNLCLFTSKLVVGIVSASVSVVADAFNNLSDAGSSVVTFIGFRLAKKPADREHPFGHGRYEYVAGLGISVVILLVGVELVKSSVSKIVSGEGQTLISTATLAILIASVLVKLWMYFFNKILSKKINSKTLRATSLDSLTDCVATTVVILGLVFSKLTGINIDGWLGIAVALFILLTGVTTFRDSLSPLLGNPPSIELVSEIKQAVMQEDMIVGVHDLIVHDYGVGRCMISLHAEVSDKADINKAHDAIDEVEKALEHRFNCMATIHLDPVATDDDYTLSLKAKIADKMCEIDEEFSIHDFRIVKGEKKTTVIFDLAIPYQCKISETDIRKTATEKIAEIDESLTPHIQIENLYSECL